MVLRATCITFQVEDDVALLGFADDAINTSQYVMLQRELPHKGRHSTVNDNRLHIEINTQRHSGYCDVVTAHLGDDRLVLTLNQEMAASMSLDERIEILLHVSRDALSEIGDHLRLLLGPDRVHIALHE